MRWGFTRFTKDNYLFAHTCWHDLSVSYATANSYICSEWSNTDALTWMQIIQNAKSYQHINLKFIVFRYFYLLNDSDFGTVECTAKNWHVFPSKRYKIIRASWKKKSVMFHVMEWLDFLSIELLGICDEMKANQPAKDKSKGISLKINWSQVRRKCSLHFLQGILMAFWIWSPPAISLPCFCMIEQPQCHHVSELKKIC